MYSYFDKFDIKMTKEQAESVSKPGDMTEAVLKLLKEPSIKSQLRKISDEDLASALYDYGAWDKKELADRSRNEERIIWIAGGNIVDELPERLPVRRSRSVTKTRKSKRTGPAGLGSML